MSTFTVPTNISPPLFADKILPLEAFKILELLFLHVKTLSVVSDVVEFSSVVPDAVEILSVFPDAVASSVFPYGVTLVNLLVCIIIIMVSWLIEQLASHSSAARLVHGLLLDIRSSPQYLRDTPSAIRGTRPV